MILFQQDWGTFPTATADRHTTNVTWYRMAGVLHSMGVKNYDFHLSLLNPRLQGVDPYDPLLTDAMKQAIVVECRYNPWYFFREVARLPVGGNAMPFRMNRASLSTLWCFFCEIDYILIMPRQNGKSITLDLLEIWLMYIYYKGTELFLFTKDNSLRKRNIERIKKTVSLLPPWLIPIVRNDADNSETITCKTNGNFLTTAVPQSNEDDAAKVGRGHTMPFAHVDEGPAIKNAHISIAAMVSAMDAARKDYRKLGLLNGIVYTTTAGDLDTKEGQYIYGMVTSAMPWNEKLYDCANKEDAKMVVRTTASSERCMVTGVFSHRQCGMTDAELWELINAAPRTQEEIDRDYLNIWTRGSSDSALSKQMLEIIHNSEIDPIYTEFTKERYVLQWYIPENEIARRMATGHYLIGVDPSEAIGRDANSLVMVDIRDMSVVMTCRVTDASLYRYPLWLAEFMIKYEKTTLVMECKSQGPTMFDIIAAKLGEVGINPFKRMYNAVVDNHRDYPEEYQQLQAYNPNKAESIYVSLRRHLGFKTTGKSRRLLYDTVLEDAVRSTGHRVLSHALGAELKGLIRKNGKVDHMPDSHDDTVIGWLLTHWFVKHSKNLQYYGINPFDCLKFVAEDGAILTDEELEVKAKLNDLKEEINTLKQELIAAPTITLSLQKEKLLAWKIKEARDLGDNTFSLDAILREVKENKVSRAAMRRNIAQNNYQRQMGTRR